MEDIQFNQISKRIGYKFQDRTLLVQALTHRSAGEAHNERLEYLGDSILGFIIAKELFLRFPDVPEGNLTRMRSSLVKGETLAQLARDMDLGQSLRLGPGELKSGGFARDSILADSVESLIGAVYMETDMDTCEKLVLSWFETKLNNLDPDFHPKDAKTRLQEYLQSKKLPLPDYQVSQITGKSHNQKFFVQCRVKLLDKPVKGEGPSRRKAEQDAASHALRKLKVE